MRFFFSQLLIIDPWIIEEFSNPGKSISHHNTTEWKPASENMLTTKSAENSLDFDDKRAFQFGANIYKKPETLMGGGERK